METTTCFICCEIMIVVVEVEVGHRSGVMWGTFPSSSFRNSDFLTFAFWF